jgi:lipoprotein-anchoring transpeptidase ErfK/SrfK
MKSVNLSRRDFIKLGSLCGLSLITIQGKFYPAPDEPRLPAPVGRARVSTTAIYIYSQPDFNSERLGTLRRDEIVTLYDILYSEHGPSYNRRWYQLMNGYAHSAYLQRVDHSYLNTSRLRHIPKGGCLGEITVPYTDSVRRIGKNKWQPLYRLYYQSVLWITDLEQGPDGEPWYRLTDDLLRVHFYIPTTHIHPIPPYEISPISPHLSADEKRIEISLSKQTLTAYESNKVVLQTQVSTGIPTKGPSPNGIPTDTPAGRFYVQTKMPSRHMGDGELTSDIEAYELLGVPWVCLFHKDGLALHGTFWHNNFGRRMSHGCVNLRNKDALWLYRWTTPVASHRDWYTRGLGTQIDILK